MNKKRRLDIWELLDHVGGQCIRLRDGTDELLKTEARLDYIDFMIDFRDKLAQVSELIEETIKVDA